MKNNQDENGVMREYWAALERLRNNMPRVVPLGTLPSQRTVALEAGRSSASIKKSRRQFGALITAIDAAKLAGKASSDSSESVVNVKLSYELTKHQEVVHYKRLYEEALEREICLAQELLEMKSLERGAAESTTSSLQNVCPICRVRNRD